MFCLEYNLAIQNVGPRPTEVQRFFTGFREAATRNITEPDTIIGDPVHFAIGLFSDFNGTIDGIAAAAQSNPSGFLGEMAWNIALAKSLGFAGKRLPAAAQTISTLAKDGISAANRLEVGKLLSEVWAEDIGSVGTRAAIEDLRNGSAPGAPKPPSISAKLEKVGLTDEITLKLPADQVGEGFRSMSFSVKGGKLRRPLTDGTLASFKGETVDFVITMDGNLVIGRGHSVLGNGKSVRFAGEIKTNRNGEIVQITNRSGHYKPENGLTQKAKDFLGNEGLDVSKAQIVEVAP